MDYLVCAGCLRSKDEAEQGFGVVFALPAPAVVNGCGYVELYGEAGSGTWAQKSPTVSVIGETAVLRGPLVGGIAGSVDWCDASDHREGEVGELGWLAVNPMETTAALLAPYCRTPHASAGEPPSSGRDSVVTEG
jgi:hypothetical protein